MISGIRETAEKLARDHAAVEPSIEKILLFDSENEIRLIEVDPLLDPSAEGHLLPMRFDADPEGGVYFPSSIALIRPDEVERIQPPLSWGNWNDGQVIWERKV
ncbi:MAG: hypothetical protein KC917_04100 [Candidatus Omnitrophica bacterium]|nr:hypothetical protein [Candidatus Omnitrophota bacterium]